MTGILRMAAALAGCVLLVLGCGGRQEEPEARPVPAAAPQAAASAAHEALPPPIEPPPPGAASVEKRALACSVLGSGPDTVLIMGGMHGDEPAGAGLARQLCSRLAARPDLLAGRRVVVAPAVNPDGLAHGRRANARGVDLNRNFPASNRSEAGGQDEAQALSEPEARFVADLIERYRPSRIVSMHEPAGCVDWDGPGGALAAQMSKACGLPVKRQGARPGSLGSYAGVDRRIPTITLELPASATQLAPPALWARYGDALLAAVRFGADQEPAPPRE